ncbi:MAG: hypothetical protein Q7T96_14340 [Methylobacter sp.]|nr:hypothetical protein [Methylobacter sp.]
MHKPKRIIRFFTKLTDGGLCCGRPDETDRQMLARVGKQFVVLLLIITLFDDLLDLVLGIVHFVFELMHLLFELIEESVENIMEHTLQTTHHESEIFIINMVLILMVFGFYQLYKEWPRLYRSWRRNSQVIWLRYTGHQSFYWRTLPVGRKWKLIIAYVIGLSCLLLWFFL